MHRLFSWTLLSRLPDLKAAEAEHLETNDSRRSAAGAPGLSPTGPFQGGPACEGQSRLLGGARKSRARTRQGQGRVEGRASFPHSRWENEVEGLGGCISRAWDTGSRNKETGGRQGSHTNADSKGSRTLRKWAATRRCSVPLTPLAWPQSLREYGFAHCGGAAPQPSLALWLLPAALRWLAADRSRVADWVAKEPFGAALVGSAALEW